MVHHSGAGPDPSRATGHGMVVENRGESSGQSRFGAVRAMRSATGRSPRDSRNIAVALALLAFAVIMFLVTIVKFDEQIQRIGMSQAREAAMPPRVWTSCQGPGVAEFCSIRGALAANPGSGRSEQSVGAVYRGVAGV